MEYQDCVDELEKQESVVHALAHSMEVLGRKSKAILSDCELVMVLY